MSYGKRRRFSAQRMQPTQLLSPKSFSPKSIEMSACIQQCERKEEKRSAKDKRRIEGFDKFEQKWADLEKSKRDVEGEYYDGYKIYYTSKGMYYNKRYKHGGKTKTKRVYI